MNTVSQWVDSPEHPGYKVKTIKKGNCTIEVLRPILTAEERTKVEAQIKTQAEKVLRDYYIRKEANA